MTALCINISHVPRNSGTNFKLEGVNVTGSKYKIHFYCLAVEAGFYSILVECLPVDLATWVQFSVGTGWIFFALRHGYMGTCVFLYFLHEFSRKIKLFFLCLYVLMFYVPVNNFSVTLGQLPAYLR